MTAVYDRALSTREMPATGVGCYGALLFERRFPRNRAYRLRAATFFPNGCTYLRAGAIARLANGTEICGLSPIF